MLRMYSFNVRKPREGGLFWLNVLISMSWAEFTTLNFLATSVWAQYDRTLDYTRSEWFASYKHSTLLGRFVSYEEN